MGKGKKKGDAYTGGRKIRTLTLVFVTVFMRKFVSTLSTSSLPSITFNTLTSHSIFYIWTATLRKATFSGFNTR